MELLEDMIDEDIIATESQDEETSELRGRGRYCRMMGYRGKAKRACKKRLRQQDRAMSRSDRRAAAKKRKAQWKAYKRGDLDLETMGMEDNPYGVEEVTTYPGKDTPRPPKYQVDPDSYDEAGLENGSQARLGSADDDENKTLKTALWIGGGLVVVSLIAFLGYKAFKN